MVGYSNIFKSFKLTLLSFIKEKLELFDFSLAKVPLLLMILVYIVSSSAVAADIEINDNNICLVLIRDAEQKRLIPLGLMQAVAQVESGKVSDIDQDVIPWPWTINVNGKGYFFKSRLETIHTIKSLLTTGQDNIDIGCMQINYFFHSKNFDTVEDMVDPVHNVAYATTYLLQLFQKYKKWPEVIKYYHSSNFDRQNKYHQNVIKAWQEKYFQQNKNNPVLIDDIKAKKNDNKLDQLIDSLYKKYNLKK